MKVYCKDNSIPCCSLCATIKHRKCQDVVAVEEVSSRVKESKQAGHIFKHFNTLRSLLDKDINDKKKNITDFEWEEKNYQMILQ